MNNIILITQRESVKLQELGYNFASRFEDGLLHKSKSSHPKYYLSEDKAALKDLYKLRKKFNRQVDEIYEEGGVCYWNTNYS